VNAIDYKSLKKDFRKFIKNQIMVMSPETVQAHSLSIQLNLIHFLKNNDFINQQKSQIWGSYQALGTEPQVNFEVIETVLEPHLQIAYPLTQDDTLQFYSNVEQWRVSSLCVREPVVGQKIEIKDIAGLIIPGLAFNKSGHRLGRGMGYYDKSFQKFQGPKIGLCYEINFLNNVPYESHDLCMDYVITEKQVYKIDKIHKQENSK